jgi:hypothetical protein
MRYLTYYPTSSYLPSLHRKGIKIVKKGARIEAKPCGLQPDLLEGRGVRFPNGTIVCSSASQPYFSKPVLPNEKLEIKKPATSSSPVSENCLQETTKSGKSLCLTTNKEAEKPVSEHPFVPCKGSPAETAVYGRAYVELNGKCVPSSEGKGALPPGTTYMQRYCNGVPC